ncbi:ketoacyl-synthetase C-terminal extension domain-containing protein [uncultured Cohaesibacter sp.]|uniref:ketoacyl-synthetase C-terminal extension domain-containing protein n=1 Tax=uncultured Cohaesibacter sp. TaxID=1002546 RepID=UPI0029C62BF3|nr:ketoacyl-synthetase C-terminal extension domain-containing protein [uncultured Cohaesibacter sp.]
MVLVLQNSDAFDGSQQKSFGRIVEAGINSDGRTSGVALPSSEFQAELLEKVYKDAAIDPDQVAFIEAHGTGTRVGDPAETFALGKVLGSKRKDLLPIGSVKSNVGHLEPASGMVSVLKSLLALEHDVLPPSLHIVTPNPDIPFEDLKLSLTREALPLERGDGVRYAGINNFGFGGTNAHVLVSDSEQAVGKAQSAKAKASKAQPTADEQSKLVLVSARAPDALRSLAGSYADAVKANEAASVVDWGNAISWHRELMDERVAVVAKSSEELAEKLSNFANEKGSEGLVSGSAPRTAQDPVFVFSGNGSQFAGMGAGSLPSQSGVQGPVRSG